MNGTDEGLVAASPETHRSRYVLPPKSSRQGTALCLSGGGFRATLFHLGGLRRLNELGLLGRIDVISSVSGGSIIAAHLATAIDVWPSPGERIADFDISVAEPIRKFTSRNLRTWPIVSRALPWRWRRRAIENLASAYGRSLTRKRLLHDLPSRPNYVFCATDLPFGVSWVFDSGSFDPSRRRVGSYMAGYLKNYPEGWPLARAVAASSCFPPVFNPMQLRLSSGELTRGEYGKSNREELIADIGLSDGGVYDNMGLEPVWERAQTVLVSDGGAVWQAEKDQGLVRRLNRYSSVAGRQGGAMRKRVLMTNFKLETLDGTYWGLGSAGADYAERDNRCYSKDLVDEVISQVRTDLDAFSPAEQGALENHGYLLADAAAKTYLSNLVAPSSPAAEPPSPGWLDEPQIKKDLASSHKRKMLGRFK